MSDPGSAAERWVMYALKACYSNRDIKTLEYWATCAAVSYTALRECCDLVGIPPGDACHLVRVLRAVIHAAVEECSPGVLLDVGDRRTRDRLLARAALDSSSPASMEVFFRSQQFAPADNVAIRLLHQILTSRTSQS